MRYYYVLLCLLSLNVAATPSADLLYDTGMAQGRAGDFTAAVQTLSQAADLRHGRAMYALGWLYSNGHGVDKDDTQAFIWFLHAAESGIAQAQHMVGVCYGQGLGVEKNSQQSLLWIKRAARHGDKNARDMLVHLLGKKAAAEWWECSHCAP
jgi:uncharacterized protein